MLWHRRVGLPSPLPRCHRSGVTGQMQEQQEQQQQQERQEQPGPPSSDSVPELTSRALGIAQRVGYAGEDLDELRSTSSIDDLLPEVRCAPALERNPA